MEEFIKADIFFYITTIAVVLLTILFAVGLIYVIIILRTTKKFIDIVKEEGEEMLEDIKDFRVKLKNQEGMMRKLPTLLTFIRKVSGVGRSRKTEK